MIDLTYLRFILAPRETIHLPRMNKGITLRGAFGSALRTMACSQPAAVCDNCQGAAECAYGFIFSPRVPHDAQRLRLNRDIPRPFVIKPPLEEEQIFESGDYLSFDLVLVGDALRFLPYLILSFVNLGERGIGVNRGRFDIKKIEALDAQGESEIVMRQGHSMVMVPQKTIGLEDAPPCPPGEVEAEFLTPILLKKDGRWVPPFFGTLMRRLRDRLQALSYFYGGQLLTMDFQSFGEKAEKVKSTFKQMDWVQEDRFSRHRGQKHTMKGWVGTAVFEGDLSEFWPFLWLGQYLHVGKAAVFGQGWYRVLTQRHEQGRP